MIGNKGLSLPEWIPEFLTGQPSHFEAIEHRMRLAVELSRLNVERKTGGPFGAAIFECESGRLVSVGVNRVVPLGTSIAHAEMMAFLMAQTALKTFDLGSAGLPTHELVTSGQMCAMCFGATSWSGVRRVICAANSADIEELTGFDEGPIHPEWKRQLEQRGIEVLENVLRDEARAVLSWYKNSGGVIYNGRRGKS